jgi:RHS repeat-associated protein
VVLDVTTGLAFMDERTLFVTTGQWLQEDPITFQAGDANLRRDVGNDPINATDVSGLRQQKKQPKPPPPPTPAQLIAGYQRTINDNYASIQKVLNVGLPNDTSFIFKEGEASAIARRIQTELRKPRPNVANIQPDLARYQAVLNNMRETDFFIWDDGDYTEFLTDKILKVEFNIPRLEMVAQDVLRVANAYKRVNQAYSGQIALLQEAENLANAKGLAVAKDIRLIRVDVATKDLEYWAGNLREIEDVYKGYVDDIIELRDF